MLLNIFIIITLNSISDKFLAFLSFRSSSGEFSCSFIWGLFLCLPILAISAFVSTYYVAMQRLWCRPMWDAVCDWPWATCLELLVIQILWFFLLGLGECGKDQAAFQGQLFPTVPCTCQQMFQSTQRFTSICRLPNRLGHWKSLAIFFSKA